MMYVSISTLNHSDLGSTVPCTLVDLIHVVGGLGGNGVLGQAVVLSTSHSQDAHPCLHVVRVGHDCVP